MKKKKYILLIFAIPLLFSGCWDQKIYEESGFVMQVGFEETNSNEMLMSFGIPVLDPTSKERTEIIYSKANLLREFREMARNTSPKEVEGGKIQQFLISETLAKKGVNELIEVIERESVDPPIARVIISEDSPLEIFEKLKTLGDKPPASVYIHDLIRNNARGSYIPDTKVFDFSTKSISPGIDPIAPIIKLQHEQGTGVKIQGTGLFSGDKLVGKLNTRQSSLLLAMMGKMKNGIYILKMLPENMPHPDKYGCGLTITKAKRKLSVSIKDNKPEVDIALKFKISISEYKWNKIYDKKLENTLEAAIEKDIIDSCSEVVKYTQEVGSDPLGIGDRVRAKYNSYFEKTDWNNEYKNVSFNFKVKVNISNTGIIQ